jgi:hypothetical protein
MGVSAVNVRSSTHEIPALLPQYTVYIFVISVFQECVYIFTRQMIKEGIIDDTQDRFALINETKGDADPGKAVYKICRSIYQD